MIKKELKIEETQLNISTEKIWQDFSIDLRRFVYSKVSDKEIVDDLIQDIFYKIHSNIHNLRDNSKLGSWLFQIARNAIMDYFRDKKKTQKLIEKINNEESYIEDTSTEILQFCMNFFMSRLPKIYKDALIFTEFEGNTQIKLSQKEGISVSAAKSRVQRARKQLKEIIINYSYTLSNKESIDFYNLMDYCPLNKK